MNALRPWFAFLVVYSVAATTFAASGPSVLVAGYESDNIVRFDLASGKWTEIARLARGSQPRGIAVGDSGAIYVGLLGGNKNVVKLVPGNDSTRMSDVTKSIGRFGPGILVWGRGKIWAAGDTDRVIYRIDPARGEVEAPPQYRNCCNLVGLAAEGDILYAAEYFQRSILRYDLRSEKAEGERFIAKSPHLNRPVGLAIGHNDNLYVANGLEPTVVEFDTTTGHYVRTFVHLGVGGKEGIHGVIYAPEVQRYYIASGSTVYEADLEGNLIASYNSPVLKKAYGIALIPSGLNRSTNDRVLPADSNRAPSGSDAFESTDHRMITLLKLASTNPSRLHITGNSGDRYRVLATSNFETWDAIGEVDNPTGEVEFIDRDADRFGRRFYRIEVIGPGR